MNRREELKIDFAVMRKPNEFGFVNPGGTTRLSDERMADSRFGGLLAGPGSNESEPRSDILRGLHFGL